MSNKKKPHPAFKQEGFAVAQIMLGKVGGGLGI